MNARPVTLLDVAREAGVSRTTASAALGGSGRLSEETRAHVAAVAERLGYRANPVARHLRRGRIGAIGLHLPAQATGLAYYMEFAFGVVERAREEGVSVTLLAPGGAGASGGAGAALGGGSGAVAGAAAGGAAVAPPQVDGFVVVDPLRGDPAVAAALASGLPVVSGEPVLPGEPEPAAVVRADHAGALRELLDHVAARGARAPALVAPDEASSWAAQLRGAYGDWCAARRIEPRVREVAFNATPEEVRAASKELLGAGRRGAAADASGEAGGGRRSAGGESGAAEGDGPPVDAIVCAPDGAALGAIAAARAAGVEVGRELLLAACVDSAAMALASPPITALDLGPRAFGGRCADALLALLAGERPAGDALRQPVALVARASTGG